MLKRKKEEENIFFRKTDATKRCLANDELKFICKYWKKIINYGVRPKKALKKHRDTQNEIKYYEPQLQGNRPNLESIGRMCTCLSALVFHLICYQRGLGGKNAKET